MSGCTGLLAGQLGLGLGVLLQLNTYSIVLGASSLALVFTYPALKRFTYWVRPLLACSWAFNTWTGWSCVLCTRMMPSHGMCRSV